jgi:hypothetical protein
MNKKKSSKKLKDSNKRKRKWLNYKRLENKLRTRRKSNPLKQQDQTQWFLNQWIQSSIVVITHLKS